MSYETRYRAMMDAKREHRRNSPEAAEARYWLQRAMDRVRQDVAYKYPVITSENASEALEYQAERIEFWRKEFKT